MYRNKSKYSTWRKSHPLKPQWSLPWPSNFLPMPKSDIVVASPIIGTPSRKRGLLRPTSSSAIINFSGIWALANLILFLLPFIVSTVVLKLFPNIINVMNANYLAIGLPLTAFFASVYTIFMGMFNCLQFQSIVCLFHVPSTFIQSELLQIPSNSTAVHISPTLSITFQFHVSAADAGTP